MRTMLATAVAVAAIAVFGVVMLADSAADFTAIVMFSAATASAVLVGLLLIVRAPGNRIGPLLLATGGLLATAYGLSSYELTGATETPPRAGAALAGQISHVLFVLPIVIALVVIPLVFPGGHLISKRWRPILWLLILALVARSIAILVGPSMVDELENPLHVAALEPLAAWLGAFASATSVIGFGGAAAAVWVRYRHGDLIQRQQVKWLLAVAGLAAIFFPVAFIVPVQELANVAFILGVGTLVALPMAIAVAILRYHLYEIDRIISRTVAYLLITALLVAAYALAILLLQGPLGTITGGDTISVALSTLVVAALFQPLRRRVQAIVDRRFDRARFDAERTTAAFSERLRDEVDIATVTGDLDATVRAALKPTALGLWLREAGR